MNQTALQCKQQMPQWYTLDVTKICSSEINKCEHQSNIWLQPVYDESFQSTENANYVMQKKCFVEDGRWK